MRVLHLPSNVGSRTSHTVRALRQIGVDAYGLVLKRSYSQSPECIKVINVGAKRYTIRWWLYAFSWFYQFLKLVNWADIIHWYFGTLALPKGLDLAVVNQLRKPGIVEWQGSDIRVPEVEFEDNPYYTAVFHNGYEYQSLESLEKSRRIQKQFYQAGFACMAPVGMCQYIQKDIFPNYYTLPRRLMLSDYQPHFPKIDTSNPLVIHSSTAPIAKGSYVVQKILESLKDKHNFDFQLIHGVSRYKALQLMQIADIYIDQLVLGDFGSASLEAMALGKPVVCYLKPSIANLYPPDLPIVNANQDNLASILEELLENRKLRNELGQRGRAYVEQHHDAIKVAQQLTRIYQEILEEHS